MWKMTGLPAEVFGLTDRGVIEEGAFADIVVFDLKRFRDVATYDDPHHLSEGVVHAFVNGTSVIEDERFTDALAGLVLRKRR